MRTEEELLKCPRPPRVAGHITEFVVLPSDWVMAQHHQQLRRQRNDGAKMTASRRRVAAVYHSPITMALRRNLPYVGMPDSRSIGSNYFCVQHSAILSDDGKEYVEGYECRFSLAQDRILQDTLRAVSGELSPEALAVYELWIKHGRNKSDESYRCSIKWQKPNPMKRTAARRILGLENLHSDILVGARKYQV